MVSRNLAEKVRVRRSAFVSTFYKKSVHLISPELSVHVSLQLMIHYSSW